MFSRRPQLLGGVTPGPSQKALQGQEPTGASVTIVTTALRQAGAAAQGHGDGWREPGGFWEELRKDQQEPQPWGMDQ